MEEQRLLKKKRQFQLNGPKLQLAVVCNNLAEYYLRAGKYELAINEYKNEGSIYEEVGKPILYAKANRMIGEAYTSLGDFDRAIKHENIHLNVAKEQNDALEEQRAYASIGRTYLTKGINDPDNIDIPTLKQASKAFMKSLMICESLKEISKQEQMDMRARLLLNIGLVQEHQGDFEKGIEYLGKSIQICKSHDIYEPLHQAYYTLGLLYTRKKDYSQAITHFNLAIDVADILSDKISPMCGDLIAKSEVLIQLADFQSAKQVLLKAYKLKSPIKEDRDLVEQNLKIVAAMCYAEDSLLTVSDTDYKLKKKLYEKMGDGACHLKNFEKAIDYYKKMLECAEKSGDSGKELIPVYVSLAQTYKDNKQYDLAIEYFRKECEISKSNPKENYSTWLSIADVLELAVKPYEDIAEVYNKARDQAHATGEMKIEGKVLARFINAQKKYGKFSEAAALEKELVMMEYVPSDSESEEEEEAGTPDIGDDINIEDISDLSEGEETEEVNQSRTTRKRGKGFTIKKNVKGETQLHVACINGNTELVRNLLEQGHTVHIRDNCGWLPLHEACNHGHLEIVRLLIDKGANINDRGGTLCNGITPLHDAASNGHLELIELMLDNGASPLAQTDSGETPLDMLKTWRRSANLDAIEQTFYETLVTKMTNALEKAGRSVKNVPTKSITEEIKENYASPQRVLRSPKKSSPLKQIGSLRYNVDVEADDEYDAMPSTSSYNRSSYETKRKPNLSLTSMSVDDSSNSDSESAAQKEYKRAIESIRRRVPEVNKSYKSPTKKKSALVQDDYVGDDWLEDDLGISHPSKKRKTGTNVKQDLLESRGVRRSSSFNSNRSLQSSPIKNTPEQELHHEIEMEPQNCPEFNVLNIADDSSDSSSSAFSTRKRKSQSSLLDSGFSRYRSDSSLNAFNTSAVTCVSKISNKSHKRQSRLSTFTSNRDMFEADSTTSQNIDVSQALNCTFNSTVSSSVTRPMLAINVRVDNKLFRIPVPASEIDVLTIGWLANETAKRYYKKEGILPTLQLETKEGALLINEDPLSMVFPVPSQPEEVQSTIVSWNLPPLPERYMEACSNSKIQMNPNIRQRLDECQGTLRLELADFTLEKAQLFPLFRALHHQNNLQHLDLSGNALFNEGLKQLCTALPSITQLRSLNLALNNITVDGIRYLSETFDQSSKPVLEHLSELNLSFNLLGDNCLSYLAKILHRIKLRVLTLTGCNFTDNVFDHISNRGMNLNFEYLEELDISYNELNKDSIIMFMSFLDFRIVRNLNVSHNIAVSESGIVKEIATNLQQSDHNNIKSLNLARCNVNDSEIWDLLRSLHDANDLESLNLSYNADITSISLRRILQHRPSFSSLILEGCKNIVQYLDQCTPNMCQTNEYNQPNALKTIKIMLNYTVYPAQADILIALWQNEWGRRAVIEKKFGNFIHLSVSDS